MKQNNIMENEQIKSILIEARELFTNISADRFIRSYFSNRKDNYEKEIHGKED